MNALTDNKRLEKYGEFYLIDQICKNYGAYDHKKVFNLTVLEVYTIKLLSMETDYLERQYSNMKSKMKK